jgi:flagellar basal body-associated protein FliL
MAKAKAKKSQACKGISLPIEMIVVIAIAVLVLVVIAAFFVSGAGKLGGVSDADAFGKGCDFLRLQGCTLDPDSITIENYIEPQKALTTLKTNDGSLLRACVNLGRVVSNVTASSDCQRACGCPG